MKAAHSKWFITATLVVTVLLVRSVSAQTVINFDNLPDLTPVTTQYSGLGVTFSGAVILTCGQSLNCGPFPPFSFPNVIFDGTNGVITATFDSSITGNVTAVSARITGNRNITMTAFDASGNVLATTQTGGPNFVGAGTPNLLLTVQTSGPPIALVTFHDSGDTYTVDDFTFSKGCSADVAGESQGNSLWKANLYDHSNSLTIGEQGCALTSLSMALNFVEVSNDPGALNDFMKSTDNDYSGLSVFWGPATRDATGARSPFTPPKPFHFDTLAGWLDSRHDSISAPTGAFKELNDALCSSTPHPVIVGVQGISNCSLTGSFPVDGSPGHYVLVTGKKTDANGVVHYTINDPGCGSHTTLDDYHNAFSTRGIVTDPPGDISELDIAVGDPAEILIIDPNGNTTGFNPTTNSIVQAIPHSAYGRDALANDETGEAATETGHIMQIFQPASGSYSITITGLKLGTYTLLVRSFSQDGSPQPETLLSGIAGIASSSTVHLELSTLPGAAPSVGVVADFQSTLEDISNSAQLGLIDNQGIANSLSQKIQAAAQAVGKTRANILNAFVNEVNAQSGKHIIGVAVHVLLADATSLLGK